MLIFRKFITLAVVLKILFTITSCKKFVEVDAPQNEIVKPKIFENNATANAAQFAIYSKMASQGLTYNYLSIYTGLLGDELIDFTSQPTNIELYTNGVFRNNASIAGIWEGMYKLIYEANAVIEGVSQSTGLSNEVKNQLLGEALFTRAFVYFYLINYFGDVPYIVDTDYKANAIIPRNNTDEIYIAIINDLLESKILLNENYVGADGTTITQERLRPNKSVVTAFLARVYLYLKKYEDALKMSTDLISNSNYQLASSLSAVFLTNNSEAIWQLSNGNSFNTFEGYLYILNSYPTTTSINPILLNSFGNNDKRKSAWIGMYSEGRDTFYFPNKYKVQYSTTVSEYVMVFRLAEQYLIRSEAKAHLNDLAGAAHDLNQIRTRAGLPDTLIATKEAFIDAILKERQKELFTEWGQRWFDLKRTGYINTVMSKVTNIKGGSWEPYKSLMPIPQSEILKNGKLSQNTGY